MPEGLRTAGHPVADCPQNQLFQLTYDVLAEQAAIPVASADQLIGTWVSDDFLPVAAGIFIPVYEVLEIGPGDAEGEVRIVQHLMRTADPAEMWFGEGGMMPPVDVAAAGRFAVYGDHAAVLAGPGKLEPRRVRYFDFPIEGERTTGLAMRMRMGAFLQTRPIDVRTSGERLVFTFFDRASPKAMRVMTYRKRADHLPRAAILMAILGEMSSIHFHCMMQAIEGPRPAFAAALGDVSMARFLAGLEEGYEVGLEMEELRRSMSPEMPAADRKALGEQFMALGEKNRALFESGPLAPLTVIARDPAKVGCVYP